MPARITTRVIIYHKGKILLTRNQGYDFWYPGGGGQEDGESLEECCKREVYEENRQEIEVGDLIYVQEFFNIDAGENNLEFFFLAKPIGKIVESGKVDDLDTDGRIRVDEVRWFSKKDMDECKQKIYPEFMCNEFWRDLENIDKNKKTFWGKISG